jgi:microcystin-dependent protein
MATITGLTAEKMLEIEAGSIVDGVVKEDGHLWLIQHDGDEIDAGPVLGPQGPVGPTGPPAVASIPGEVKLWPGSVLPVQGTYGKWVWADGSVYAVATYPVAAGHIAPQWKTFGGASDPGASNFRVPDLRGVVPVGMDAMPGGARANRMTRAVAITIAAKTGEETHVITLPEMAAHAHGINDPGHAHAFYMSNADSVSAYAVPDGYSDNWQITAPTLAATTGITIQNAGGNGAHENVQPSVFVPYIVRLDG